MGKNKEVTKFASVHKYGKSRKRKRCASKTSQEATTSQISPVKCASKRKLFGMSTPPNQDLSVESACDSEGTNMITNVGCLSSLLSSAVCPKCKDQTVCKI